MNYINNPYATHQPTLLEILKITSGNIIELGCGDGSTKLIRDYIDNQNINRKLYSLESNKSWLDKYENLGNENHKLYYVDASNVDNDSTGEKWVNFIENSDIKDVEFEVCFIDQSPWTARTHTLNYFKNKCKFIIVHDVDYFPANKKWGTIIDSERQGNKVKYNMNFSDIILNHRVFYPPFSKFAGPTGPPTLLCSNLLNKEEFNNININIDKYYE